jgi:glyoxylase-like metal-dependent hydrolase (beta-lactamase superfamily II)
VVTRAWSISLPTIIVSEEIRLLPTPGHTPDHVSAHQLRGEQAVITGDLMHHPINWRCPGITPP